MKAKPSEIKKMAALLETDADSSEDMAVKVWDLVEQITAARTAYMAVVVHPSIKVAIAIGPYNTCLLYTSPSPRDRTRSRMPSSA